MLLSFLLGIKMKYYKNQIIEENDPAFKHLCNINGTKYYNYVYPITDNEDNLYWKVLYWKVMRDFSLEIHDNFFIIG